MKFKMGRQQIVWIVIIFTMILVVVPLYVKDRREVVFPFNSQRVARAELHLWKSYYDEDYIGLYHSLVELLTSQFNLSYTEAIVVSGQAVKSARTFAALPLNTKIPRYQKDVLPSLETFFQYLKEATAGQWNYKAVAIAELNWWVYRRNPRTSSPENVGKGIAKVYTLMYGRSNEAIEKAGYLRAKAAYLRDEGSRKGHVDWNKIQLLLDQSYAALVRGISIKPPPLKNGGDNNEIIAN